MELEEAKKIILDHLDELCTVKITKWVLDESGKEYIEVDAGYSKKELELMQYLRNRDMKKYIKLRGLIDDLI